MGAREMTYEPMTNETPVQAVIRLAHVIQTFEADFKAQYAAQLRNEHYQALGAIKHCRSQASPKMQAACTRCDHQSLMPHSCGHRACPQCQHHESWQWLERQLKRQLPVDYFMVTFTLPCEFRALSRAHPREVFDALMHCAWDTVRTFSINDRQLKGTPGAIAVLHTNTRTLDYHPHVHLVMPAAALNLERRQWRTKARTKVRKNAGTQRHDNGKAKEPYLFHHKALAKVFRAKLLAALEGAGLHLPARHPTEWIVDCKHVGGGEKALIYLGRYLYRGVIREQDIVSCEGGQVCFKYRNAKTGKMERRTVPGAQFLWLVLQHILPKGFRRARNFGFLHHNCKRLIALLHLILKFAPTRTAAHFKARASIVCPCCGAVMKIVKTRLPARQSWPLPQLVPQSIPIPKPETL